MSKPKETEQVTEHVPSKSPVKVIALALGSAFAFAHLGLLGYVINRPEEPKLPQVPTINIPRGEYSSYKIKAGKDGYEIEYKANDPAILESQRSLSSDSTKKGLFGGGTESRREWRRDQFTMDGTRNLGGATDDEGKLTAKRLECIKAEGGGESTGRIVGASLGAAAAPWFTSIPYVGWVAAGWIAMFGQDKGAEIGGELATTMMEGCDEL